MLNASDMHTSALGRNQQSTEMESVSTLTACARRCKPVVEEWWGLAYATIARYGRLGAHTRPCSSIE